jgi:hypothetical protein
MVYLCRFHKPESLLVVTYMHYSAHENLVIRFLTVLLETLEIRKYLKHLRAKDGHHSNVEHSETIASV